MSNRYWEMDVENKKAIRLQNALADLISHNVVLAVREFWEGDGDEIPVAWVEFDEEKNALSLVVSGPGKPTHEDPSGVSDVFTAEFNLLDELKEYAEPYGDRGPRGPEQEEDMRQRVASLRGLAESVKQLADKADPDTKNITGENNVE
jgi:hypothetical protein